MSERLNHNHNGRWITIYREKEGLYRWIMADQMGHIQATSAEDALEKLIQQLEKEKQNEKI